MLAFLEKRRVLYAVPTAEQINRFWKEITEALAEPIEFGLYRKSETEKTIEVVGTEQRIRAKTAWNANTLRGDYGDVIILDEFQLMAEDALGEVVYPMLIDNNGDLVLIYTPPSLHTRAISKAVDKRHAAKLYKKAAEDPRWMCMHFTSHDNPHISEEGIAEVSRDMTQLAIRQEIMAQDADEVPGALWSLQLFDDTRVTQVPPEALPFKRVVVGVDPTGSTTNEAGIMVAALGANDHGYLLADKSLKNATPRQWGSEAVWVYWDLKADRIAAEENYGGEMVEQVLRDIDENISYRAVTATRGKLVRAEPICAMYERHLIHNVGVFPEYEEECCSYVPGLTKLSPNRMDAAVWAFTELFPENQRFALIAQAQEAQSATMRANIGKVHTNGHTEACSFCGKHSIVRRGPIKHCTNCGKEELPGVRVEYDGPGQRAELMK